MPSENSSSQINLAQLELLKRLSNACAVSGDEGEVRKIVLGEVRPYADEVKVDALGNVLAIKHARQENPLRVMLAAHMDEVGLMLTHEDGDGVFRFEMIGGISPADVAGKLVWIGRDHITGVVGLKPFHYFNKDEQKKPLDVDDLYVDIGPARSKAQVGDRATFATSFLQVGPSVRGKALDDRLGVATLVELLKQAPPHLELLAVFTVQEEIGSRGARVAAFALNPDVAIILDSTPAYDLPAWEADENVRYNTRLDAGPAIYVADIGTLSDPRLVRYLIHTAEEHGIPYQLRQPGGGGTDASVIHRQREGIPSISVSVPGRYHHSPASIVRLADWQHTMELMVVALSDISHDVLSSER